MIAFRTVELSPEWILTVVLTKDVIFPLASIENLLLYKFHPIF